MADLLKSDGSVLNPSTRIKKKTHEIVIDGIDPTILCEHQNTGVKYDAEDCAGKNSFYVREHYPRFYGPCPDCGLVMINYASWEHYAAGDW